MDTFLVAFAPEKVASLVCELAEGITNQIHPGKEPILYHVSNRKDKNFRMLHSSEDTIFTTFPHITLLHGVALDKETQEQIMKICEKHKSLTLDFDGIDYYKELGDPFTINLTLKKSAQFIQFQNELSKATGAKPPEGNTPHITLFYDDSCDVAEAIVEYAKTLTPPKISFTIDTLKLMKEDMETEVVETFSF
jgi:2'-5' RNA ligase